MIIVTNHSVFGQNLRFLREKNHFTQSEMAQMLNMDTEHLQRLENAQCLEVNSQTVQILKKLLPNPKAELFEELLF